MATKSIDIATTEASLSDLVLLVNSGVEVVFTRDSQPMARLVSAEAHRAERVPGLHSGAIHLSPDFDDALSDMFWAGQGHVAFCGE